MKVYELISALSDKSQDKEVYLCIRGQMNDHFSDDPAFYDEDLFVDGVREDENGVYICTCDRMEA